MTGLFCRGVLGKGRAMARPYTAELRERVLLACERGGLSRASIAALFRVGESTVYRWQRTWRTEGRREAKPHAGGPAPRLGATALDELEELVAESNDRTLAEYAAGLLERTGVAASGPTICRALRKLDLRRKKRPRAPRSGSGRTSPRRGPSGGPSWPRSIRGASSSSMRAASTPA